MGVTDAAPTHSSPPASANTVSRIPVTPLTATAVAVLTSAYVHRNRVPVLELTPVWTIGEHRPRRRTPDPSCGVRSRPRYNGCIEIGGPRLHETQKVRNIRRDPRVSLVVDEPAAEPVGPGEQGGRGIEDSWRGCAFSASTAPCARLRHRHYSASRRRGSSLGTSTDPDTTHASCRDAGIHTGEGCRLFDGVAAVNQQQFL